MLDLPSVVRLGLAIVASLHSLAAQSLAPVKPSPLAGSMQMMSPAVVASWVTERPAGDSEHLRLLVLWRGTPGWFLRPGGSSVTGQQAAGRYQQTVVQGGVTFTLEYDSPTRTAIVDGKAVKVEDRNVVFVDDVDSAAGPRVTGTMRIESRMPGSAGQIGLLLRDSPEIKTFLRCDATSPDGLGKGFL